MARLNYRTELLYPSTARRRLRNPEMQKLMYPYLPEPMRNPATFEMLLDNPMYKAGSTQCTCDLPPLLQVQTRTKTSLVCLTNCRDLTTCCS
jgi:hypothetical protein